MGSVECGCWQFPSVVASCTLCSHVKHKCFSKVVPLLRRIEIIFCPIYFLRVKYFNNFCFIYFFLICSKAFMFFLQVSSNFVIFTEVFLHYWFDCHLYYEHHYIIIFEVVARIVIIFKITILFISLLNKNIYLFFFSEIYSYLATCELCTLCSYNE